MSERSTERRRGRAALAHLALAIGVLAVLAAGCMPRARPVQPKPKPEDDGLPKQVVSQGITVLWQEKGPGGYAERVMQVNAETGDLDAVKQSGTLHNATGFMFRQNKARARFQAPVLEASRDKRRVTARGGVTITSIDPPGAVITADRVTWDQPRNQVLAEGNVQMVYQPPGPNQQPARGGPFPHVRFDTDVNRLRYP